MRSLAERLRTLLVLGRISNLPTVWSNLLAGWIISGGEYDVFWLIPLVLFGGSFLYIGGMYLNDFCDAGFDARYCPERPIPAGKISRRGVGAIAVALFTIGLASLAVLGPVTAGIALLLLAAIVLYNFHHKNVAWAPLLMGFCRLLLYPLAASSGQDIVNDSFVPIGQPSPSMLSFVAWRLDITLAVLPAAIPLALYVAGITYLARGESRPSKPTRWALLLLLLPVLVSCGIYAYWNSPSRSLQSIPFDAYPLPLAFGSISYRQIPLIAVLLINLLQLYWMAWLLVPLWRKTNRSIGRVVSGLLAGIVLVDMIALVPLLGPYAAALFPLFLLALLLQRVIPAT